MTALQAILAFASAVIGAFGGWLANSFRSERDAARMRATSAERALERAKIECSQERARTTAERERATEATARRDVVVAELQEIAKHAAPEVRLARLDAALKRLAR